MPVIEKINSDIFTSDCKLIAIAVNTIGVAGKGIAKTARDMHPDFYYYYKQACRYRKFNADCLMVIKVDGASYQLLCVPTKIHFQDDSEYEQIETILNNIATMIIRKKIKSLALPALGCGAGKLKYSKIKKMVYDKLDKFDIPIELYSPIKTED